MVDEARECEQEKDERESARGEHDAAEASRPQQRVRGERRLDDDGRNGGDQTRRMRARRLYDLTSSSAATTSTPSRQSTTGTPSAR